MVWYGVKIYDPQVDCTPLKTNMEPENHLEVKRKNHLPVTPIFFGFQPLVFRGFLAPRFLVLVQAFFQQI